MGSEGSGLEGELLGGWEEKKKVLPGAGSRRPKPVGLTGELKTLCVPII